MNLLKDSFHGVQRFQASRYDLVWWQQESIGTSISQFPFESVRHFHRWFHPVHTSSGGGIWKCITYYTCIVIFINTPAVHRVIGCGQKSSKLVWRCLQLLSGFLAKGYLPRVSRQSRRSLMIRVIIKWSQGLCADLLEFALKLRGTLVNLS